MDLSDVSPIGSVGRATMADRLYRELRRRIQASELVPGDRISTERELMAAFGVSRPTVREAMARLVADGLVRTRQGTGAYVTESPEHDAFQISRAELNNLEDVRNLLELRLAIETEMARLAAQRRTADDLDELHKCLTNLVNADDDRSAIEDGALHATIARSTHNGYFERIIDFIGTRLIPPRSLALRSHTQDERRLYAAQLDLEHRAIVEAIARGHEQAASDAMRTHLSASLHRHLERTEAILKSIDS